MEFRNFLEEVNYPTELVEEEMTHITIDLNMAKRGVLNETLFGAFAGITKWLLKSTMGLDFNKWKVPVRFSGNRSQLSAFEKAFKGERKYIRAAKRYGLDNPQTYKSKYSLERSIRNFESTTGMKWPIE